MPSQNMMLPHAEAQSVLFNTTERVTPKEDLDVSINNKIREQGQRVIIQVIALIGAAVIGGIIASLWELNGKISELVGKYNSPIEIIKYQGDEIEKIKTENENLRKNIENRNIENINSNIAELDKKIDTLEKLINMKVIK